MKKNEEADNQRLDSTSADSAVPAWYTEYPLTAANYLEVPYESILFWASAGGGAMGESGRISLFASNGGDVIHYHGRSHYWDFEKRQWFSTGLDDSMIRRALCFSRQTWGARSMGMGNTLYYKKSIENELQKRVAGLPRHTIYRNMVEIIHDVFTA